jgi:Icc-related predicted phosphoesterase
MHPVSIRIAAAGDVHIREANREQLTKAFAALAGEADLVLLAGDLTTHGEPEQGAWLAEACAGLDVPILAVLGNHDWHADRTEELTAALAEGGITVLERESRVLDLDGCEVGVVGLKGFVGGFPGSSLPDFGEPLLREVYRQTSDDLEALDGGLRAIAHCPYRIVLMHYSPCADTLRGEPEGIWGFLGNERLAGPIREHEPDLVLHGHAHAGTFEARLAASPVYNVSVPVMGRDFWLLELASLRRPTTPIH